MLARAGACPFSPQGQALGGPWARNRPQAQGGHGGRRPREGFPGPSCPLAEILRDEKKAKQPPCLPRDGLPGHLRCPRPVSVPGKTPGSLGQVLSSGSQVRAVTGPCGQDGVGNPTAPARGEGQAEGPGRPAGQGWAGPVRHSKSAIASRLVSGPFVQDMTSPRADGRPFVPSLGTDLISGVHGHRNGKTQRGNQKLRGEGGAINR